MKKKFKKIISLVLVLCLFVQTISYACGCSEGGGECDCEKGKCPGGNVGARVDDKDFDWSEVAAAKIKFTQFWQLGTENKGDFYALNQSETYKGSSNLLPATTHYYEDRKKVDSGPNSVIEPFSIGGYTFGYNNGDGGSGMKVSSGGANVNEGKNIMSYNAAKYDDIQLYPYIKMRYKTLDKNETWQRAIMFSENKSSMSNFIIAQVAVENPQDFTLGVESQWDGHTKTMDGLKSTGILDANGDDRNVVVHGGSTVFIHSNGSDQLNGTTLRKEPLLKIGIEAYMTAIPDDVIDTTLAGTAYDSKDTVEDVDDESGETKDDDDDDSGDGASSTESPYTVSDAKKYMTKFAEDVYKNIGHYRLTKVIAEGIYRQGEEEDFLKVAERVDPNESIRTTKTFGSFNGTAGTGKGNTLDYWHDKYYLNDSIDSGDRNSDQLTIDYQYKVDEFKVLSNIGVSDGDGSADVADSEDVNVSVQQIIATSVVNGEQTGKIGSKNTKGKHTVPSLAKIDSMNGPNSADIKPKNEKLIIDDIAANKFGAKAGGGSNLTKESWGDMNKITGWLSNYINFLDMHAMKTDKSEPNGLRNISGTNYGWTVKDGITTPDDKPYSINYPTTRMAANADVPEKDAVGSRDTWYCEGQDGMSLIRLQAIYYVYLDETKWEVVDPALCGQLVSSHDQRNWKDNNNDGKTDSDLTNTGALKDKIRTFRYELSPFYVYNDGEKEENYSTDAKSEKVGDSMYIGTIGPEVGDNLKVYLDGIDLSLKSKLMYQDNITVERSTQ